MRVLFLFGPNFGALGRRDPERYGTQTLPEVMQGVEERGRSARRDLPSRIEDAVVHEVACRVAAHDSR